jgi:hypothetical protein
MVPMSSEEQNMGEAIVGPITVAAAIHPVAPHEPVAFMMMQSEDGPTAPMYLGTAEEITGLLTMLIKTQNLLNMVEDEIADTEADCLADRMEILSDVAQEFYTED